MLFVIYLIALIGASYAKDATWVGTWGVVEGCASTCCCPREGSLIKLEDTGLHTMKLVIKKGVWTGCGEYDWSASFELPLPWDDEIPNSVLSNGRDQTYQKSNSQNVVWTWRPALGVATESASGVKVGDPVGQMTYTIKGTSTTCTFMINANIIKVGFMLLLIVAVLFVF